MIIISRIIKINVKRLVLTGFMLFALPACAGQPVSHSFSFGGYGEDQGIEVLDYQYGDSKLTATHPPDWALQSGHIGQSGNMHGTFPVGNFLYVKWRVLSTGKVYEDTVDLKKRLPDEVANKTIHFIIKDSQLYVYVIEYVQEPHAKNAPDCPVNSFKTCKCTEIYPERWKNF